MKFILSLKIRDKNLIKILYNFLIMEKIISESFDYLIVELFSKFNTMLW